MEDLIQVQDLAKQLQILLQTQNLIDDHNPFLVSAKDLVSKIQQSNSNGIFKLNSSENDEISQSTVITPVGSPCSVHLKTKSSGVTRKSAELKDRKVGVKRRKAPTTWETMTATPINDGRAWRKYGQKDILNAKYPRSYFRCTHKYDQKCQATKQVQQTEENPSMYRTIYLGHHTCKDSLKAPQVILDSSPQDTSYLLSFQSNFTSKQDSPFSPFFTTKMDLKRNSANDDNNRNDSSQSPDFLDFSDLMDLETSRPPSLFAQSTSGSEHGDVMSSMHSSATSDDQSFDMGAIIESVDFDDEHGFLDLLNYN